MWKIDQPIEVDTLDGWREACIVEVRATPRDGWVWVIYRPLNTESRVGVCVTPDGYNSLGNKRIRALGRS